MIMNFTKLVSISCFFFCTTILWAQKGSRIHELGLVLNPNLDVDILYKTGTNKHLFRLRTLFLNGSNMKQGSLNSNRYRAGLMLGVESRKPMPNQFFFSYGFDIGVSWHGTFQYFQNEENIEHRLMPALNALLGVGYVLKKHWVFSLELMPYLSYGISFYKKNNAALDTAVEVNYGVNLSSVKLVIAYRFGQS